MTVSVDALERTSRYFAAWNAGDPEAVLASLEENGWYADPVTKGPIRGEALAGTRRRCSMPFLTSSSSSSAATR
jgi:hypothetical protein